MHLLCFSSSFFFWLLCFENPSSYYQESMTQKSCAPLACLFYRFIAEEVAGSRSAVSSVITSSFISSSPSSSSSLPLSRLIFIKSFGLHQSSALISWGHRRAVTQANDTCRWGGCSPYNRVWHPACDGLTQLPCPVSKVNQVKQSVFFFCLQMWEAPVGC